MNTRKRIEEFDIFKETVKDEKALFELFQDHIAFHDFCLFFKKRIIDDFGFIPRLLYPKVSDINLGNNSQYHLRTLFIAYSAALTPKVNSTYMDWEDFNENYKLQNRLVGDFLIEAESNYTPNGVERILWMNHKND